MMLLDTSGLLCLQHRDEPLHDRACRIYREAKLPVIHNYILAEYVALVTIRRLPRLPAIAFISDLVIDSNVRTIWVDRDLHDRAIDLLLARPDKTYSICDAAIFLVMRDRSLQEALTTDRHFEQESFIRQLQ